MNHTTLVTALSVTLLACGGAASEMSKPAPTAVSTEAPATDSAAQIASADASKAPNFSLPDLEGNTVELAAFAGKTVVLEWFNPGCPFVKYAHGEGPLKDLAAKHATSGVVWLAINSGAPGKQGHGASANSSAAKSWSMNHPVLLDESGEVGKLYGATSTPAMFVINGEGAVVYKGALDNAPLGKAEGAPVNYVEAAIAAVAGGTMPEVRETASYGCSVKYAQN